MHRPYWNLTPETLYCETDTARLFKIGNSIIKIFRPDAERTSMCAAVIQAVVEKRDVLSQIHELVLPNDVLYLNDKVIGYRMPYIQGVTLREFLRDSNVSYTHKLKVLSHVHSVLRRLSQLEFYCAYGDLHEDNVIVKGENAYFIDMDGIHILKSRPMGGRYINRSFHPFYLQLKYHKRNGYPAPNYDMDVYCLISIVMNWLMGETAQFETLGTHELDGYLEFLHKNGFPETFLSMVKRIKKLRHNYFDIGCFPESLENTKSLSYSRYINYPYNAKEINDAAMILNQLCGTY